MIKKISSIVLALLCFSVFPNRTGASDGAFWVEIDFAQKFIEDGFYDMAETKLMELLLLDIPKEAEAKVHLLLGKIYYDTDQFQKALSEFYMVEDRFKNTGLETMAVFWIAETYYKEGSYEKALSEYQKVISSHSSGDIAEQAQYSIAWCYEKMEEFSVAAASFQDFLQSYPEGELAISTGHALGDVLFRAGRHNEAVRELEKHISRFPVNPRIFESYYLLGECYYCLGDMENAIVNFRRASRAMGSHPWKSVAEYKVAEINLVSGEKKEALKWFHKVANNGFNPEFRSSALMAIASIESDSSELENAVAAYYRILREIPENTKTQEAYFYLGELYRNSGDLQNSLAIHKEALLRYPKGEISNRIRCALARVYADSFEPDKAVTEYLAVAELSKDEDLVVISLISAADILKKRGDVSMAADIYDRVLTEYPDSRLADHAQYEVGSIMVDNGKENAAILAFQSMIINFPSSSYLDKVYYRLGVLYSKRGDNYSSLENFNKVINEFPDSTLVAASYIQKANTLYRMGRYEEVLAACSVISKGFDKKLTGEDHFYRRTAEYCSGWAYYRLGQESEAYDIFSAMITDPVKDDLVPGVIFWFGEYFYGKGDFSKAREHFSEVMDEYSESNFSADAEYWMGWALYDDNMVEESIDQFLKVAMADPAGKWAPKATLTLGDISKKRGDTDGAIKYYEKVAGLYRGSGISNIANNRIGIILKAREQYVLAAEYFTLALTGDNTETNAQIQFDLAECYEKENDKERALEEYLKVEYRYPAGEFWLMRSRLKCAELFEALGDISKAYKMYEKISYGTGKDAAEAREKMEKLKGL